MKRIIYSLTLVLALLSCGNDKQKPPIGDTSAVNTDTGRTVIGTGAGGADSLHGGALNGARVTPLDTATPGQHKPKQ